jgi:hypothetical protein
MKKIARDVGNNPKTRRFGTKFPAYQAKIIIDTVKIRYIVRQA